MKSLAFLGSPPILISLFIFITINSLKPQKSGNTSTIPPKPNHAEPKLNDEEEATPSNKPTIVDGPTTLLDFDDPFETGKVADKTGTKTLLSWMMLKSILMN